MSTVTEEFLEKSELVFAHIRNNPDGILQSELWKELEIDSRSCSRIVKNLEEEGRITRQEAKGSYLIKALVQKKSIDPMLFMAGEALLPCVACEEECDVPSCKMLEDWIYELVFAEMD